MRKRDLARKIAKEHGVSFPVAEKIINAFWLEVVECLGDRQPVYLNPLGVLRVKELSSGRVRVWLSPSEEMMRRLGVNLVGSGGAARVRYELALARATPRCLTAEQREEMERFYTACPAGLVVDHIVPIQGKYVSGLHVPWNLQYLSNKENFTKANKHDGAWTGRHTVPAA